MIDIGSVPVDADEPAYMFIMDGARMLRALGFEMLDPGVVQRAVDYGRRMHLERCLEQAYAQDYDVEFAIKRAGPFALRDDAVVYYMRVGNRVKIGYTRNLVRRVSDLTPEEVLVTEPGPPQLERTRHDQFSELRETGEWFRLEEPLAGHIQTLRHAQLHQPT